MPRGKKPSTKAEVWLRLGLRFSALLFLGVVAFFATQGAWHMFQKERDATDLADTAQRQLALLVSQKQQVESDTARLSTRTGTEAALRERYGVVKPGEGVIQIVQNESTTSAANAPSSQSFFGRIIHILWPW